MRILILCLFAILLSCTKNGVEVIYYDTGEIEYKEFFKNFIVKKRIYYYKNGNEQQVTEFDKNGDFKNVKTYNSKSYLIDEIQFKNNLRHGIRLKCNDTGLVQSRTLYIQDVPIVRELIENFESGDTVFTDVPGRPNLYYVLDRKHKCKIAYQMNIKNGTMSYLGHLLYSDNRLLNSFAFYYKTNINLVSDTINIDVSCYYSYYDNISFEIKLGELDSDLNFIDSANIRTIISDKNFTSFKTNHVDGYNLKLGKIYFKHNDTLIKEQVFYTEFYY